MIAASDEHSASLDEAQFALGEGPSFDAIAWRRPVLTADIDSSEGDRWPMYRSAAHEVGVRGVLTFPLHIGATVLGVLSIYLHRPESLVGERLTTLLAFATEATRVLLDGSVESKLESLLEFRSEIYIAQGMTTVDAGLDLPEALLHMRAHAFAHGLSLVDVARSIIAGDLTLKATD